MLQVTENGIGYIIRNGEKDTLNAKFSKGKLKPI
jgi:hypothetical protein